MANMYGIEYTNRNTAADLDKARKSVNIRNKGESNIKSPDVVRSAVHIYEATMKR